MPTVTLTRLVILLITSPQQAIVYFLVPTWRPGMQRNNQLFLGPAQKQNIVPWPSPLLKSHGSECCSKNWKLFYTLLPNFGMTTWVPLL
jgi:hypothetical protein